MSYEHWPYLTVLCVLVAASLGVPIPEDIPLLTGGYMCHLGLARLPAMIAVGMVGVLSGDVILFSMGRRFGPQVVEHRFFRAVVSRRRLELAENLFSHHGVKIIFAARFLPGLRAAVFMAAGVLGVPFSRFILVNGLAACLSVPTLVVLGSFFGHNIDRLKQDVRTVTHFVSLALLVVGLIGLGVYFHRRQKAYMAEAAEEPFTSPVHDPPDRASAADGTPHVPDMSIEPPSAPVKPLSETISRRDRGR